MTQEEFYSFLAMFDVKIAEKYKQDIETKKQTDFECDECDSNPNSWLNSEEV